MNEPSPNEPVAVAVAGCGRMGRLHARVYSEMPEVRLVGVYDENSSAARQTAEAYGTRAFESMEALADAAAAVTVAVPTTHHEAVAAPLLARGIACLVEKPLAGTSREAQRLVEQARAGGALLQVGHIERFNPVIRSLRKLEIGPRFIEVTRISPLTFRSIDVGVVLDIMIHDIDIVLSLAGSEVAVVESTGVSVIGGGEPERPAEDICNARLTFANRCVANLTASRLALKTERKLRLFSPEAYVSIDYQKKHGIFVRKTGNLEAVRSTVEQIRSGAITDMASLDFTRLVHVEQLEIDDVEPLRAQAEAFITSVTTGSRPVVSGEDGLRAVETAERIVASIPTQRLT